MDTAMAAFDLISCRDESHAFLDITHSNVLKGTSSGPQKSCLSRQQVLGSARAVGIECEPVFEKAPEVLPVEFRRPTAQRCQCTP